MKYSITLTPVGKFFFGGDMKFRVGNSKDEQFDSYIIRSRKFPQQTSLLGMLRLLILSNDTTAFDKVNQKIIDTEKAELLIGKESFKVSDKENDFGKIKSISPCFLQYHGTTLYPSYSVEADFTHAFEAIMNEKTCKFIPNLPKYQAKKGMEICYNGIKVSEIFMEDKRIGIDRNIITGLTEEDALFKQIAYRLKEGYCFALEAEVSEIDLTRYSGQLVTVGGDNSQFIIQIKPIEDLTKYPVAWKEKCALTLLSDALISPTAFYKACFAITDIIPFKCMQTTVKETTGNYNRLYKSWNYSRKVNLYRAGSIFYFENKSDFEDFKNEIEAHNDFRQIGYNYYTVQ